MKVIVNVFDFIGLDRVALYKDIIWGELRLTLFIFLCSQRLFSFLLCNVIVAAAMAANLQRTQKNGFILYALNSLLLNSRVKNKTSFEFILCQLKTLNKILEKILYSGGFTKPAIKFCD